MTKKAGLLARLYYDTRLKHKMLASYAVIMLLMILAMGLVIAYAAQGYMDYETRLLSQNMEQINYAMDSFFEIYMSKSDMIFNNVDLQTTLTYQNKDMTDVLRSHTQIHRTAAQYLSDIRYPFIKGTYYFGGAIKAMIYAMNDTLTPNWEEVFSYRDIADEPWCKDFVASQAAYCWQSNVDFKGTKYIVMSRKLIDFTTDRLIGILRIYIPVSRVQNIITSNINNNDYHFLYMDGSSVIVSVGSQIDKSQGDAASIMNRLAPKHGTSAITAGGQRFLGGYLESGTTGWRLVYFTPLDSVTKKIMLFLYILVAIVLISIVICAALATVISTFVTKRISALAYKAGSIRRGNLKIESELKGNDEIGMLDKTFNDMIVRLNILIESEYKSKIAVNRARFELLQEQINPHLLYNTLSTISYIAKKSNQNSVMEISNNLIQFYRGILNDGRIICSIRFEIEMIKRYIQIMKLVYGLNTEIQYDLDDAILDCYSIKLILQPIVENAILHGVRTVESGIVVITGKMREGELQLIVSDNGVGIERKQLEKLKAFSLSDGEGRGYGIASVVNRINLFFGSGYGMAIDSEPGIGTTVTVTVPALSEEEIRNLLENG